MLLIVKIQKTYFLASKIDSVDFICMFYTELTEMLLYQESPSIPQLNENLGKKINFTYYKNRCLKKLNFVAKLTLLVQLR